MDAIEKVRSEELRREMASAASEPRVVVVELDLPKGRVEAVPHDSRDVFGRVRFRVGTMPPSGATTEQRIDETRRAIEEITGRPADRFFRSSGSFVIEANGRQIRRVAELPSVAAIWPNLGGHRGAA